MPTRYLIALLSLLSIASVLRAEPVDFDRAVAPILAARCLECHNAADHKGNLDLSTQATAFRTKDPVIIPGKLDESYLWEQVDGDDMPPKKPLNDADKAVIKAWISEGAKWGKTATLDRFAYSTSTHAGADWWSLQPVKRPALPVVKAKDWPRNPIDFFVLEKLEAKNLAPAPPADPRVLIRRVTFDLIGLPPTAEEVEAFVKECENEKSSEFRVPSSELKDKRPESSDSPTRNSEPGTRNFPPPSAYERLIDRLLASPHYGERWARHWLDVARYTESQGFEYDRFRPNAWHYRDYVIRAFNSDKPYDIFIKEQIAGDVITAKDLPQLGTRNSKLETFSSPDSLIATSLLVCGPYDQAGNSQANKTQRAITREEEMEDLISVIGQTFLGMTINCARCHSHKFDPITQEDYYRLKSVFDGVRHGERAIATPASAKLRSEQISAMQQTISEAEKQIAELESAARGKVIVGAKNDTKQEVKPPPALVAPVARWTFEQDGRDAVGVMHGELAGGAVIRDGRLILTAANQLLRTAPLKQEIREKTLESWVYLTSLEQGGGSALTLESGSGSIFDSITFAERQQRKWIAGSNNFLRTKDLAADEERSEPSQIVHMVIVYRADGSIALHRNGKRYADEYKQHQLQTYKAGDARVLFGIRHTGAGGGFLKGEIEAASLYDRALSEEEIANSFAAGAGGGPVVTMAQLLAAMSEQQRNDHETLTKRIALLRQQIASLPVPGVSYVGTRQQPAPTHRLNRGDVNSPAEVVAPAGLSIIRTPSPDFGLTPDAPEAERRIKLALWLADAQHPLTARVMVNRIWHHHFGRGIVETPNDFGFSGGKPSHPELLDWLAAEFAIGSFEFRVPSSELKDKELGPSDSPTRNSELGTRNLSSPWSIKRLHKLILLSATYRQSAAMNERAAAIDADNALLWRFAPRRVEGEIIRDAMLAISGQLNPQLGGPSFKPFTVTNHGSDFYHLKDLIGPEFNRRTIYRAHVNSGKSAMMDALDCPDPSIKTPARRVTTTPLAALALMNNSFVQRQAKHFAERVLKEANNDEAMAIALAYRAAFGRPASENEMKDAALLVKEHGMSTLCWALINATEFMYIN